MDSREKLQVKSDKRIGFNFQCEFSLEPHAPALIICEKLALERPLVFHLFQIWKRVLSCRFTRGKMCKSLQVLVRPRAGPPRGTHDSWFAYLTHLWRKCSRREHYLIYYNAHSSPLCWLGCSPRCIHNPKVIHSEVANRSRHQQKCWEDILLGLQRGKTHLRCILLLSDQIGVRTFKRVSTSYLYSCLTWSALRTSG